MTRPLLIQENLKRHTFTAESMLVRLPAASYCFVSSFITLAIVGSKISAISDLFEEKYQQDRTGKGVINP